MVDDVSLKKPIEFSHHDVMVCGLLQAVLRRRGGEHEGSVTSPYGGHGLGTVYGFGGRPGWRICQSKILSE